MASTFKYEIENKIELKIEKLEKRIIKLEKIIESFKKEE